MMIREAVITYKGQARKAPACISSSDRAVAFLRSIVPDGPQERLVVLGLNSKNAPIGWHVVAVGGLTSAGATPGDVFRWAIMACAVRIILCHNHPSGSPFPSKEDDALTAEVQRMGAALSVNLLDHIILGSDCHYSYTEAGRL